MKLSTMFLIIISLQFCLIVFSQGTFIHGSGFLTTVLNPTNWSNSIVLLELAAAISLVIVAGTFVGTFVFGKSDTMLFASPMIVIIAWATPIVSFYSMLLTEFGSLGFGTTDTTIAGTSMFISGSAIMAAIFTAPLFILAVWSIWGWWRTAQGGE